MLTPIARSIIFKNATYIDNYIAGMQQAYSADFDMSNAQEKAMVKKYYDHLHPFQVQPTNHNKYGEMAYPAGSKADYTIHFPLQTQVLLEQLDIHELYLMQFITTDFLTEFPFENFTKKNLFKKWGGVAKGNVGYRFRVTDLSKVLPLFFFSRHYDTPVVFLFSANPNKNLCLRMCDDGNFHYNVPETDFPAFIQTANQLGFVTEGDEICQQFSVFYLNKPELIGNTLKPLL